MSIAMDTVREGFPSSPAAEVVEDNFDIEFFRPCSMKEEDDASDAESGFYKTMAHDEGDTEDEACSSGLAEGVFFVNKCSSQVYRMTWASSPDEEEEEEEEEIVEGEEQEERSVLKDHNRDPREEDRAFWKACLAHGYP